MKYHYKPTPLPSGGFDWVALLRVAVSRGSTTATPFEAIIDSGSPECLFHGDVARAVGIADITTGAHSTTGGIAPGALIDLYAHEIRLGIGSDSFKITGKFSDQLPIAGLLGRRGFFDKYVITFDPRTNASFRIRNTTPKLLGLKILPASPLDPKISGAKIAKTSPTSLFSKIGTKRGGGGGESGPYLIRAHRHAHSTGSASTGADGGLP